MAWSGAFNTRFTAEPLTAHRTYNLPDQDGTIVVASAGSIGIDRLSASSVFANVATISAIVSTRIDANQVSASGLFAVSLGVGQLTASAVTVVNTMTVGGTAVIGNLIVPGMISASTVGALSINVGNIVVTGRMSASAAAVTGVLSASSVIASSVHAANISAGTLTSGSLFVAGTLTVSGATVLAGSVAMGSTLTVSGTIVAANLTVAGRISASAGAITGVLSASSVVATGVHSTNISAGTLTAGSLFVDGTMTVSGASVMLGAVAMGSTLTVSGTAVIGNLTVPGRISASAAAISAVLSAEGVVVTGGVLTIHRTDALGEGGQITLNRSTDNSSQFAIDVKGSGTATADNRLRIFNLQAGVELYAFDLLGRFSAQAINVVGTLSVAGSTIMIGPVGMGSTLTVSGTVVAANMTVSGNITASTIGASRISLTGIEMTRVGGAFQLDWPAGTVNTGFELAPGRDVDGACFLDFHATSATDYDFRIIRNAGAAGVVLFEQTGGGAMLFRINLASKFQLDLSGATAFVPVYMQQTLTVSGAATLLSTLSVSGTLAAITRINTPVIVLSPASTATAGAVVGLDNLGLVATNGDIFSEGGKTIAQYGISWEATAGAAICRVSGNQGVIFFTGGSRKAQVNASAGISTHNTPKAFAAVHGSAGGVSIPHSYNISAITRASIGVYTIAFASDISTSACCLGSINSGGVGILGASNVTFGDSSLRSVTAFAVMNGANSDEFYVAIFAQTVT